jgi:hypothetical protein
MKTLIFQTILNTVSEVTEVSQELLLSEKKQDEVVEARTILIWFCRRNGMHANDIARFVKRKHANSVNDYLEKYHYFNTTSFLFRCYVKKLAQILPQRIEQLQEEILANEVTNENI